MTRPFFIICQQPPDIGATVKGVSLQVQVHLSPLFYSAKALDISSQAVRNTTYGGLHMPVLYTGIYAGPELVRRCVASLEDGENFVEAQWTHGALPTTCMATYCLRRFILFQGLGLGWCATPPVDCDAPDY